MQWYYVENGESKGPFTPLEMQSLVDEGVVHEGVLVWRNGQGDWKPYAEVAGVLARELGGASREEPELPTLSSGPAASTDAPTSQPQAQTGSDADGLPFVGTPIGDGQPRPNPEITAEARSILAGNWGVAVLAIFVVALLRILVSLLFDPIPILQNLLFLFLLAPFELGLAFFFLQLRRERRSETGMIFRGFQHYWTAVGTNVVRGFFIGLATLGAALPAIILFVATERQNPDAVSQPGFIALLILLALPALALAVWLQLRWSLIFYLIAEHPSIGVMDSFAQSAALMKGFKIQLILLYLRFFGWALLCLLTFGIGFLWLAPYVQTSVAVFYSDRIAWNPR